MPTINRLLFAAVLSLATGLVIATPSDAADTSAASAPLDNDPFAAQRSQFLKAEAALKKGNRKEYLALKKKLADYPLYPYLIYADLRKRLGSLSNQQVNDFVERYSQTPLARRMRSAWLGQLAKQKKWDDFLAFYQDDFGVTRQCQHARALLATGQQEQAWPLITTIWLHGKSRPKVCDPVFKQWQDDGHRTDALTWQRISLALDDNQLSLARYLAKALPDNERPWFEQWLQLRKNPEIISATAVAKNHPYRQLALTQGLEKLARKDLGATVSAWELLKHAEVDEPQLVARVEKALALQFLKPPSEDEFDYLVFAEPCHADTKVQEIRIRAGLLHGEWTEVLRWLDRLPDEHREDDRWMYWRARSLEMLGQPELAETIYQLVANERSFYGFLAADRLGLAYQLNNTQVDVQLELLQSVSQLPALQRAGELFKLERYLDARREWHFASGLLDENELLAAARLAHDWGWHDRAIFTLARAKAWDDLSIRFPLEHKPHVLKQAETYAIDPAWIFAMMRQESAFMEDAQSPVGAMGLMQLMPRTADSVAKKLKQRKPSKADLFDPGKNIRLGTAYLKEVYDRFEQHAVLAIAAYNAGPHRVQRWLPENRMPADIWIEMVPFRETRNYLKSVLAYMVIYADKLGDKELRLNQKMRDVALHNDQAEDKIITAFKDQD